MRKNKTIERGLNHVYSTIKEMADFFMTRIENLKPREEKKNLLQLPRKRWRRYPSRKDIKITLTRVLWSLVKNFLCIKRQLRNTVFHTEYTVTLMINATLYGPRLGNIIYARQERAKCYN